ncbi:MAG: hypothetical protein HQK79_01220 [Desulfobacterales bacterium]|nr:hypothetical protein [Desulfobacterales bacterium]
MKNRLTIVAVIILIIVISIIFKMFLSKDGKNPILQDNAAQQKIDSYKVANDLSKPASLPKSTNNKSSETPITKNQDLNLNGTAIPPALSDTKVDGVLRADSNGKLIINRDIRHVFDYFLSARSQESLDTIISRIKNHINNSLPSEAAKQATEILNSYIAYQNDLKKFEPSVTLEGNKDQYISELKKTFQERMDLRRKNMGDKIADVFFAEEESYDNFNLQNLEIQTNDALSKKEKDDKIKVLEDQLPEELKERYKRKREEAYVESEINELFKNEGNEQKIHQLRESVYGKEAADRLGQLDKQRKEWQNRVEEYQKSKDTILGSSDLSNENKQTKIKELEKNFNGTELIELEILEKIRAQKKK